MPLPAPANPINFVNISGNLAGGVGYRVIDVTGSAVDLTATTSPTKGYCARAIKVGATAGNVVFIGIDGIQSDPYPASAGEVIQCGACVIGGTGDTTASPIGVIL